MPIRFTDLAGIARRTGKTPDALRPVLERMADKGLVMDFERAGRTVYVLSPTILGFFEFVFMRVRDDMLNGFGVAHGGIAFSLADTAFAFACNTHGRITVSIENAVTYPAAVKAGDMLTAETREEAASNRIAYYRVEVRNQNEDTVALFRGTAYRTSRFHFPEQAAGDAAPRS